MSDGINMPTLQLAKTYTDQSIEGIRGKVVGKNCTIKEIIKEGKQNKVTFQWISDSGEIKEDYMYVIDGTDGKDGVQRVRLTADDTHIYDSDHNILSFLQVKELIMDPSKFVTLTIFDNISFLPSAYDETAIWFDVGFIEEGTPNQLRIIINDQNKVKIDQIELAEKAALVALQTFCKVSEASDNALQQKEDGLYVKKSEPYDDTEVRDMITENTADITSLDGRLTNTESDIKDVESDISDLKLATQDLTDNKVDKEENKSLVAITDISQITINKNAITLLNDNDDVDGSVRNIVKRAVEGSMHLSKQFINHKPTVEEAKENILYLVPIDNDGTCEQYVLAENKVVMIGSTKVDLSNYYNKQEVDAIVDEIQLYKFPNAIIYGQPTINNGQISGFSSDNYLGLPFVFDTKDRGFEILVAFTTNSDVTTAQNIFGSKFCIALYIQNGQLVFRAGNGSDWSVADITTTLLIKVNTTYYVKIAFNKLNYTISYSTNGEDYESIGSKVTTIPPTVGQVNIGIGNNQHNPFNGIISLNKTFIKLNNTVVWEGMDDVGLASRLAIDLENIDETGIENILNISRTIEILEYITDLQNGKQDILTNPLTKSDVVNNLTSTTTNVPLSAAQGKALNDAISSLSGSTLLATITQNTATNATVSNISSFKWIIIAIKDTNNNFIINSCIIPKDLFKSSGCYFKTNYGSHTVGIEFNSKAYLDQFVSAKYVSDTSINVQIDKSLTDIGCNGVLYGIK